VVLVQKWMHDAAAFEALAIEEQEKVMGRTKETSTELAEEVRGAASHVWRTVIEDQGGRATHLPPQHPVRDGHRAWDDVYRLQLRPAAPGPYARSHGLFFFVMWYSTMEGGGKFSQALVLHS
jgi:deferrochelatase/peroxidase EfeB